MANYNRSALSDTALAGWLIQDDQKRAQDDAGLSRRDLFCATRRYWQTDAVKY
jgi:hypothetical protein